jgi:hypothetical protein
MRKVMSKRPSLGTAMGFLALVIALGGVATAEPGRTVVKRGDIAPGAVTARALAPGAIHAKALARGAVNSRKLADGAVNQRVLAKGAVTVRTLAPGAVTASAIAPGSIYGAALGPQSIKVKAIADLDEVAENGTWTASNSEVALCAPGEALLGTGFLATRPGNREVSWLEATPFLSPSTGSGVKGRISSNSGGSAEGQIMAICLK